VINSKQLHDISRFVEMQGLNLNTLGRLRAVYPGMHFTYCMDDEINEVEPVETKQGFNIYLVDARLHCLRLTDDPADATGVVLAEVIDE